MKGDVRYYNDSKGRNFALVHRGLDIFGIVLLDSNKRNVVDNRQIFGTWTSAAKQAMAHVSTISDWC